VLFVDAIDDAVRFPVAEPPRVSEDAPERVHFFDALLSERFSAFERLIAKQR
jgi:hypothetical protein